MLKRWIPLIYQDLIFGTVVLKIIFQRLALSYMPYMKINLNYDHASYKGYENSSD
jgi:hypothetical protein